MLTKQLKQENVCHSLGSYAVGADALLRQLRFDSSGNMRPCVLSQMVFAVKT